MDKFRAQWRQLWRRPEPADENGLVMKAHRRLGWQFWVLLTGAAMFLLAAMVGGWYVWALQPRDSSDMPHYQRVVVEPGDSATAIAYKLEDAGIIRSSFALRIYTEISGTRDKLQTGGYLISSSESVPDIVAHLVSGKSDEFDVTILAGLTIKELSKKLHDDGYTKADITTALETNYQHPLFDGRPSTASLEGYIYPETYRVNAASGLSQLFERSFDEFYQTLKENKLLAKFEKRKLNLYEAITLASIVQKEVSDPEDQRRVAQVFYLRLKRDMPLGSDPTFKYAAEQLGIAASPTLESPYNTRIHKGLPPGPISNMELSALQAVAQPAKGDYLYFVSGDDGTTHFSKTLAEHEANVARYCTTLCQ